ncbi:methylmalonyl-CoA mutase family protein [candidate division KSB1 bacterium]|nr:methylmalonyl-CoA mutase family protein [candidate division KSB1 bacterium]NIR70538.1 methylmalonyl-CoA mutase family protein [candidate division KSB1 bacterium]NIS26210.1 methylmalonyl-CoA mutase family protein [candidate division KSB1 bacterium]NIT72989.1 methylmalonyl-CoA mutase family protein [candidate division KSB1 bacterium]NIU26858.1 methylmalonyl-CoA mutase family protein [candidate division KSB1 bacterium]
MTQENRDDILKRKKEWEQAKNEETQDRPAKFVTVSSEPVDILSTPDDTKDTDYLRDVGFPGEFPYTRGIHHNMYRGRLWTMRQFAGFGTPKDTNKRFKYLLEQGQTGLSVAFDLPTLMGVDSDNAKSQGEVGICGVAVDSLADMEMLFDSIPLDKISTSMTINSPAAILLAFYICVAEKQGVPQEKLRGTLQNDILKEYIAQKEFIFPPEPSMRIFVDSVEYCTKHVPMWNTVSISGYHIREAGSTAAQELAFTLADGFAYVEACIERGLDIDDFAPRFSFFFNSHIDFFEEIAKYRAARRIYAKRMRDRYGAKNERSWKLRFHTQTAGCSLTGQQPENNIVRTAFEALAAVLGGTQSLHTNSLDETWALPSEWAAKIALRTQQIIAHETGTPHTIDPLAGSYFVENLTNKMEKSAEDYFDKIDALGGVIPAIEKGFFQKEIANAARKYQEEIEKKERFIVGVNAFKEKNEKLEIPILRIEQEVEQRQIENVKQMKKERNQSQLKESLQRLREAAGDGSNLMPHFIDCAKAYATIGEMVDVLKGEFGEYKEPVVF